MKQKRVKFPKRAKLITDGGFSMMIDISKFTPVIKVPLLKRIQLSTPETDVLNMDIQFEVSFGFYRTLKKMAIYKQINVVNIIK